MKNLLSQRILIPLFGMLLLLSSISCGDQKNGNQTNVERKPTPSASASPSAAASPSPTTNSNSSSREVVLSPDGFSTDNVCSLPKSIAGNSPFAGLGGGKWEKWGDTDGDLEYGCNGGSDSIKLEDKVAKISARYNAMGGERTAHYISAKYTALQYGGKVPVEEQLRQRYLDFCNDLSNTLYGQKLSEKFVKRMGDAATYSTSGTANELGERVGNGYVNLATKKEKEVMIAIEVRFFANEAEFKKYKDR